MALAMGKRVPSQEIITQLLSEVQEGLRSRLLNEYDARLAREIYMAFARYCKKHGLVAPYLEMTGGTVPLSYRWLAETTALTIYFGVLHGVNRYLVSVRRAYAHKSLSGKGMALSLSAVYQDENESLRHVIPGFVFRGYTFYARLYGSAIQFRMERS